MELFNDEDEDLVPTLEELALGNRFTKNELRNTRSRVRNQVNRDLKNSERRAVDAARRLIDQTSNYAHRASIENKNKRRNAEAVCYAAANLANKVLNSFNIQVPVTVTPTRTNDKDSPGVTAYTDFRSISITIDILKYQSDNPESMARLMNDVKAIVYHEGGHLLFTHEFAEMCKQVHQKLGVDYNDYGYFPAAKAWPGDAIKFGLDNDIVNQMTYDQLSKAPPSITLVLRAWNILEDQRMETAVVNTSPVMARYLAPLVLANVATPGKEEMAWPWVIGRKYLPKEARDVFRDLAMNTKAAPLLPRMEEIVMQYRRSNDIFEMYDLSVEFAEYVLVWLAQFSIGGDGPGNPGRHNGANPDSPSKRDKVNPVPDPDAHENPDQPKSDGTKGDKGDKGKDGGSDEHPGSDSSPDGDGDKDNEAEKPSPDTTAGPAGTDTKPADRTTNEAIRNIRDQLERKNLDNSRDSEINQFVADIHESTNANVAPDRTRQIMNDEERQRAVTVNNEMRDVLDKLMSDTDPSWTFYQESGVLDPVSYELADPGDTNYWSGLSGEGRATHNLSVTMLLDTSGSMAADDTELSVVAMGIRKACEHIGVMCTVMTFNDEVRMVVAGDDNTDYVRVAANGGTEVFDAMQTLNSYRYGKDFQLVIILTDGEWSDVKDLRMWSSPGRHIMLVGFRMGESYLSNKGSDSVISINNLSELPAKVTNALAGYFM
jgi:hypothetical protein